MKGDFTMNGRRIEKPGLNRGMMFQDCGLFLWMSTGENIMLALEPYFPGTEKRA